jgi:outer membrane protein OmpA-like peptidoglycan-associated protein
LPLLIDVPAYVEPAPQIQNNVIVVPGHNWDIARAAAVTPIVIVQNPLPLPAPAVETPPAPALVANTAAPSRLGGLPDGLVLTRIHFEHNGVKLSIADKRALAHLGLQKNEPVVIAGFADPHEDVPDGLSSRRARAVAMALQSRGYKNVRVTSYGAQRDLTSAGREDQMVEIYQAPAL